MFVAPCQRYSKSCIAGRSVQSLPVDAQYNRVSIPYLDTETIGGFMPLVVFFKPERNFVILCGKTRISHLLLKSVIHKQLVLWEIPLATHQSQC